MAGKAYVIVGATGTGKTTFVRQTFCMNIENKSLIHVYDIGNEYGTGEVFEPFEDWVKNLPKVRDKLIILEEATMNLDTRSDIKPLREALVRKRHNNTIIVFVFHSLYRIPQSLCPFIDGWFIFRTNDLPKTVFQKFADMPDIIDCYRYVNLEKEKHVYMYATPMLL